MNHGGDIFIAGEDSASVISTTLILIIGDIMVEETMAVDIGESWVKSIIKDDCLDG